MTADDEAPELRGVRGYGPGCHVMLGATARHCLIELAGSMSAPDSGCREVVDRQGRATALDGSVAVRNHTAGDYQFGGASLTFSDGRRWTKDGLYLSPDRHWTDDGLYPGIGVKWVGAGGLIGRANGDLDWVDWVDRANSNVAKSGRGRKKQWPIRRSLPASPQAGPSTLRSPTRLARSGMAPPT